MDSPSQNGSGPDGGNSVGSAAREQSLGSSILPATATLSASSPWPRCQECRAAPAAIDVVTMSCVWRSKVKRFSLCLDCWYGPSGETIEA